MDDFIDDLGTWDDSYDPYCDDPTAGTEEDRW